MADNHSQRPYRPNEAPARNAPAAAPSSAGDPLAELARLIGQSDPFAEFGRTNARRGAVPQEREPATDWAATPAAPMPPPVSHQAYSDPSYATGADPYPSEHEAPEYPVPQAGGYEANAFQLQHMQQDGEQEEFYDDVAPPRRRMGIMAIAAVFALAVIGTAGAFGYRALFGNSGSSQPPPVIKADTAPSKIVPANAGKAPNKLIYDRVADHAQGEKLVSREEQPIDMKPPGMAGTRAQDGAPPMATQPAALGSGVISSEPKKIRTIAIHPGREAMADTRVAAAPAEPPPPAASTAPKEINPEVSPQRRTETRAAPPAHRAAAPAASNAPLSLSPNASEAAPAAPPPMRTASAPARTASTQSAPPASGGYAVQVSSQRSEAEAQASFRSLQAKYPNQLGGRQAMIHRVELGAKGIYYRALVGPFASAGEANALCSDLKAAGGQCLIQRN
jgi:SPOR domain